MEAEDAQLLIDCMQGDGHMKKEIKASIARRILDLQPPSPNLSKAEKRKQRQMDERNTNDLGSTVVQDYKKHRDNESKRRPDFVRMAVIALFGPKFWQKIEDGNSNGDARPKNAQAQNTTTKPTFQKKRLVVDDEDD